jgi:hypothetical protein
LSGGRVVLTLMKRVVSSGVIESAFAFSAR